MILIMDQFLTIVSFAYTSSEQTLGIFSPFISNAPLFRIAPSSRQAPDPQNRLSFIFTEQAD